MFFTMPLSAAGFIQGKMEADSDFSGLAFQGRGKTAFLFDGLFSSIQG
jgi:hypothetical protein